MKNIVEKKQAEFWLRYRNTGFPFRHYLTAAATRSTDGNELALLLLNRNTVDGYGVSLDLGNFFPASEYTRIELVSIDNLDEGHNDLFDHNTYGANAAEQVALKETEELYDGVIDIGPHQAVVIKLSASLGPPNPNQPPIANAGADQTVNEGIQVILDGSASHDPDPNDVIDSYQWIQTSGPPVTINNSSSVQASFEAPEVTANTTLEFMLTVTDDNGSDNTATTAVTVIDTVLPVDPGMIEVVNADSSNVPIVDFTAGQTTVQISYGNPEGHPVKGVVQQLDDSSWKWLTAIDETAGEITAGLSPGWVDLGAQVFHYDGKWGNGSWAIPNNQTREFRIRLKLKINGSWHWSGIWVNFKIKR